MKWHHVPNIITVSRFFLVIPVVFFQINGMYTAALLSFIIAGVSDGLDGYLAKRFQWVSRLGSILDPLADKCLLIFVTVVLTSQGHLPLWLLLLIIARDLIIVTGAIAYNMLFGKIDMVPSFSSKMNTFFQILLLVIVLSALSINVEGAGVRVFFQVVVAVVAAYSGGEYILVWGKLARQQWVAGRERR